MPPCARIRDPVPIDIRVRSLLGSVCWSLVKADMSFKGSDSFLIISSTEFPPGIMRTS